MSAVQVHAVVEGPDDAPVANAAVFLYGWYIFTMMQAPG